MRDSGPIDADSGEPVAESPRFSRGTALKVGGIGLAGALAALMPGRAGATVRRHSANESCLGTGFLCLDGNQAKLCGYDSGPSGQCFCGSLLYGKIRPGGAPVGGCVENFLCRSLTFGDACNGQRDCGPGYACITGSCCTVTHKHVTYKNFCLPYCQQGSIGQARPLNTPKTAAHK